jgi:hypothetical protein
MANDEKPKARPFFRRLAAVVAIFCFIFAALFGLFMPEDGKWFGVGIGLFVGFVMATIAATGYWPRKR